MASMKMKSSVRRHHPYIKKEPTEPQPTRTPSPVPVTSQLADDKLCTPQNYGGQHFVAQQFASTPLNPDLLVVGRRNIEEHFYKFSPVNTRTRLQDDQSTACDSGYKSGNSGYTSPPHNTVPEDNNKRGRTMFTKTQVTSLEEEYSRDPYLSRPRRLELAAMLRIPEGTIKIWFQNRRMKEKRNKMMIMAPAYQLMTSQTYHPLNTHYQPTEAIMQPYSTVMTNHNVHIPHAWSSLHGLNSVNQVPQMYSVPQYLSTSTLVPQYSTTTPAENFHASVPQYFSTQSSVPQYINTTPDVPKYLHTSIPQYSSTQQSVPQYKSTQPSVPNAEPEVLNNTDTQFKHSHYSAFYSTGSYSSLSADSTEEKKATDCSKAPIVVKPLFRPFEE